MAEQSVFCLETGRIDASELTKRIQDMKNNVQKCHPNWIITAIISYPQPHYNTTKNSIIINFDPVN